MRRWAEVGAALAASLALFACASGTSSEAFERVTLPIDEEAKADAKGPCVIVGTALEAASGRVLGGALVEAPGGISATTDAAGRFELVGLARGVEGELRASIEIADGTRLRGQNRIRPLAVDRLEVVIYLSRTDT